ncbi:hypothetical protein [Lysinibacillus fusiformis]
MRWSRAGKGELDIKKEAGTELADIQDKREIDAVRFPFLLI